ncbi:GNAT family N-acetyltransferase [Pseudoalteromonas denitrificans]|uniref:Acetyltransferase, GNAT family n=1 Tax=Pseudoalteromonas denitrificans DSM 6059 TaxID=1123010 RepID=A0A1I1M3F4_9GAMM|nr:GNAT family N-acetyltransferase [Pseudoalteromonas denitrificans]SFC79765.1 Acetyltransferase, GNAT family [Pseudoalteromonas denitrificans DSM 6059]
MIKIRAFKISDAVKLHTIFFNTVRNINIKDYTQQQVEAWAPEQYDHALWEQRMQKMNPYIATINEQIVGYADLQDDGLIDHFFCHTQFQGKGIGKTLINKILQDATDKKISHLYSHVSITAKPFFEHFCFTLSRENQNNVRGQVLKNYVLEKQL